MDEQLKKKLADLAELEERHELLGVSFAVKNESESRVIGARDCVDYVLSVVRRAVDLLS